MCIIPCCFDLDEDWEEQHEKLAELLGEKSRDEENHSRIVYELEDDEECAYPGPPPQHLRQGRIDDRGNFAFDQDNEDAADVAASVSQLILDDDDIESLISRPINFQSKSIGAKVNSVIKSSDIYLSLHFSSRFALLVV